MKQPRPVGNQHPTKFESTELLYDYAERNGLASLVEKFAKWERRLSRKQYSIVEVQTAHGPRRAMLLPKETLKAAWDADPFRRMLLTEDARQVQRDRRGRSAVSPVGEPMGTTPKHKQSVDKDRVRSETDIEVGNY